MSQAGGVVHQEVLHIMAEGLCLRLQRSRRSPGVVISNPYATVIRRIVLFNVGGCVFASFLTN